MWEVWVNGRNCSPVAAFESLDEAHEFTYWIYGNVRLSRLYRVVYKQGS